MTNPKTPDAVTLDEKALEAAANALAEMPCDAPRNGAQRATAAAAIRAYLAATTRPSASEAVAWLITDLRNGRNWTLFNKEYADPFALEPTIYNVTTLYASPAPSVVDREKDNQPQQEIPVTEKTLGNTNVNGARKNVPDLVVFGNGDAFKLFSKASSQSEGWMKSTKVLNVPTGCVVQVTTQQRNPDGTYAVAEALTFVPNVTLIGEGETRRFIACAADE